jgi:hypothetical protein
MPGGGLVSILQLAADPWDESFKLSLEGYMDMFRAKPGGISQIRLFVPKLYRRALPDAWFRSKENSSNFY